MTIKLGIVMDPISAINIKKDSSFAMLEEAPKRGYELFYLEMKDLYMQAGRAFGTMRPLTVKHDYAHWFSLGEVIDQPLSSLDVILMRKDPPFDTEFIYATYMLERAEDEGCLIVNKPQSLRDANEKLYTAWFAEHTPTTLVTRRADKLRAFHAKHKDVILLADLIDVARPGDEVEVTGVFTHMCGFPRRRRRARVPSGAVAARR